MYRLINLQELEKDQPSQPYWPLAEANAELKLQNIRDTRVYSESVYKLREEYLNKLHSLIGENKLEKYLKLHSNRLEEMKRARKELPPTAKGLEELSKLRQRAIQKSKELIDGSGINVVELKNLQGEFAKSAAALIHKTISKGEYPHADIKDADYRKNQIYTPPYLGEDSECFSDRSRGNATSASWTHSLSGEVGAETRIRIRDADDSDFAFALCRPRMRIVYIMPIPGPLTVRVQLWTINDQVSGSYEDECGYSGYDFHQRLFVYAQRTWPDPSARYYHELPGGSYSHFGGGRGLMGMLSWISDFSTPGDISTVSVTIPARHGAVPDEMMGIDVGIETLNYCWVNDVTIFGHMNNSYLIREIRLLS